MITFLYSLTGFSGESFQLHSDFKSWKSYVGNVLISLFSNQTELPSHTPAWFAYSLAAVWEVIRDLAGWDV